MVKINIGDKVVVKKPNNEKGGLIWSKYMDSVCSKEITVSNFIVEDMFLVEENTWAYKTSWVTHVNGQLVKRPYENWKMSISKHKFKRCTENLPTHEVEGILGFIDGKNGIFYYRPSNDKFISAKVYHYQYPDTLAGEIVGGWEFVRDSCDSESKYVGNIDLYDVGVTHYEEDGSALLVPAEKLMELEWEGSSEDNVIASFSVVGGSEETHEVVEEEDEYTGGSVNYYKLFVEQPTNLPEPYEVECNDIIEALDMNYAEGNAFKAIWRKCAAKKFGIKKKGYDNGLYDSEKVVFFGKRMVEQSK